MKSIDFISSLELAVSEVESWPSWKSEALMDVFGVVVHVPSLSKVVGGFSFQDSRVAPEWKSIVCSELNGLTFTGVKGGLICYGKE